MFCNVPSIMSFTLPIFHLSYFPLPQCHFLFTRCSVQYRLGHRYCTSKFVAYPSYKIQCERSFYLILTYNLVDFDCVQYVYVWILWLPCLILFVTWELLTKIKPSNLSFNITRHPSHPTQALVYLFAGHSSLSLWFLSLRLLRCKVRV